MSYSSTQSLIALQTPIKESFSANLDDLLQRIENAPRHAIILACEVALSGFCYDKMDQASAFSQEAKLLLKEYSKGKSVALTLIDKEENNYFNNAYIFHNGHIIYKRAKNKLFQLGKEHLHFKPDKEQKKIHAYQKPEIVTINSLKVGVLVCFELRFTRLWDRLKGCDVILVPSLWGHQREQHFITLVKALALTNQCFVVAANGRHIAKCSIIATPFGIPYMDKRLYQLHHEALINEIKQMREYIVLE